MAKVLFRWKLNKSHYFKLFLSRKEVGQLFHMDYTPQLQLQQWLMSYLIYVYLCWH